MASNPEIPYLTVREFADRFPVSEKTVRRRIDDGSLPHIQPGGKNTKLLIPEDAFALLQNAASHGTRDECEPKARPGRLPRFKSKRR